MRLAYADPPYPGKAHLYPENTEVDHVELVARLMEYDGWALSTDEINLAAVLALCPPRTRVLAWCRENVPPFNPHPIAAWEPVLLHPARTAGREPTRSYFVGSVPSGPYQRDGLTGQKSREFCEWVIRCLGAEPEDTLDDLFPGTGVMADAWERWLTTPSLPVFTRPSKFSHKQRQNRLRRIATPLEGLDAPADVRERPRTGSA